MFHIAQLEPAAENTFPGRTEPPPPPEYDDQGNALYVVSVILDSKFDYRFRNCHLRYFIRWAGYEGTDLEYDWVSAADYNEDEEIVVAFHTQNPDKPGPA